MNSYKERLIDLFLEQRMSSILEVSKGQRKRAKKAASQGRSAAAAETQARIAALQPAPFMSQVHTELGGGGGGFEHLQREMLGPRSKVVKAARSMGKHEGYSQECVAGVCRKLEGMFTKNKPFRREPSAIEIEKRERDAIRQKLLGDRPDQPRGPKGVIGDP